jgi:hypothetical protein
MIKLFTSITKDYRHLLSFLYISLRTSTIRSTTSPTYKDLTNKPERYL